MATDKTAYWSNGEVKLWYSPTSDLDVTWSNGEPFLEDEYSPASGLSIPVAMYHYTHH